MSNTSVSPNSLALSDWVAHGETIVKGFWHTYQCHQINVYLVDLKEIDLSFDMPQKKIIAIDFVYPVALNQHSRSELAKVAKVFAKKIFRDSPQQERVHEIHISFIVKSLTFALGEGAQIGRSEWEEYFVYPSQKLAGLLTDQKDEIKS